ncbi:MAG: lysophospholipid acyltransferase family protein [Chitinophagaceae bacterium]
MSKIVHRIFRANLIRKLVFLVVGAASYPGLAIFNKLRISGTEHLKKLPKENVLFVSNHQTYFADVITFFQIFCAVKWGKKNKLGLPYYLLNPFTRVNYVAAVETMRDNLLTRLFLLAGGITVKRTWRACGQDVRRGLDPSDTRKIVRALAHNWVITFPQGTTRPFAPGRKGTALIIKECKPIVVPIVINGFWRAFNKKGLRLKKRNTRLSVQFKAPLVIDYEAPADKIMEQIMDAIEQSKAHMLKGRHHRVETIPT